MHALSPCQHASGRCTALPSSSNTRLAAAAVAPTHSRQGRQDRRRHLCQVVDPLLTLASTDPAALQDVIVGGAVTAAVGAAIYSGLKQEPVPCDLCAGNGGIRCFACSGTKTSSSSGSSGGSDLIDPAILQASSSSSSGSSSSRRLTRGSGSSGRPGSCRVCKGKGLVLCSKCKGSGYVSTF